MIGSDRGSHSLPVPSHRPFMPRLCCPFGGLGISHWWVTLRFVEVYYWRLILRVMSSITVLRFDGRSVCQWLCVRPSRQRFTWYVCGKRYDSYTHRKNDCLKSVRPEIEYNKKESHRILPVIDIDIGIGIGQWHREAQSGTALHSTPLVRGIQITYFPLCCIGSH